MMKKWILTLLPFVSCCLAITKVNAVTVIDQGPNFSSAQYEQKTVDIEAKVMGGYISFQRHWSQGEWQFNPNWQMLSYGKTLVGNRSSSSTSTSSGESELTSPLLSAAVNENYIYRGRYKYDLDPNSNGQIYRYDANKWIEKTALGFTWFSRNGEWIKYSTEMQIVEFGNTLGVLGKVTYNGSGQIETVTDRFGTVIFTLVYSGEKIASVTDYTGRQVSYHWQDDYLVRVNDLSGHDWSYSYDYYARIQGSGPAQKVNLIKSITDPENRTLTVTNKEVGGRFQSYCRGSNSYTRLEERVDPDTGLVTVEEVVIGTGQPVCGQIAIPLQKIATATVDNDGNKTQFSFAYNQDSKSYSITSLDEDGVKTQTEFGDDGGIKKQTKGDELVFSQAKNGNTKLQADSDGNITTTNYDQYDNIISIVHPDGAKRTASYHPSYNFATRVVNENGVVTEVKYNTQGLALQKIQAKGLSEQLTTTYSYYANGMMRSISMSGSSETKDVQHEFEYDNFGNLTKETINQEIIWQYLDFTPTGEAQTVIDGRGHTWRYVYDNYGRLTEETNPLGHSHQYTYDKVGNTIKYVDANKAVFEFTYDARDYLVEESFNQGKKRYKYNSSGIKTYTEDQLGNTRKVILDRSGRPQARVDGNNVLTSFEVGKDKLSGEGSFDQLSSVNYPTYSQAYKYDERSQISQLSVIEGQQTTTYNFRYNPLGELISETDPNGNVSYYSYDAHGNLTEENESGFVTTMEYDSFGNLLRYTDRNGVVTSYELDVHGRQIKKSRVGFGSWLYGYDNNHNLTSVIDPNGQKIEYIYDEANNEISQRWYVKATDNHAVETITFGHDANGNITSWGSNANSGVITWTDTAEVKSVTIDFGPFTKKYENDYYLNDLLKSIKMPNGIIYSFDYDKNAQLTRFRVPGEGSLTVNEFNWLAPVKETLPGGITRNTSYNGTLNTENLEVFDPAGSSLLKLNYDYGLVKEIKAKTADGHITEYLYDSIYRLEEALTTLPDGTLETEFYQVDANGDRIASHSQTGWVYNDFGQLKQRGAANYEYDANGNQVKLSTTNSYKKFIYDIKDRLIRVEDDKENVIASYKYDPFDRRVSKTVAGKTTYYLYSLNGLIAEYDELGNEITSYAYKPDSDWGTNPVLLRAGPADNKQTYYYHNDQLGTPYKITDNTGYVVWNSKFDAFGNALEAKDNRVVNNLRFPGQYFDAETGLHYNWKRYYDPLTGRYITPDPIGILGGPNLYSYVDADPINRIDPNGECAIAGIATGIVYELIRSQVTGDCFSYTITDLVGDALCGAGKLGKLAKATCGKNSFSASTLVHTATGLVPISEVKVGTKVLSYSEIDQTETYQSVTDVITSQNDISLVVITLDTGEVIESTALHPFYHVAKGWTEAKTLQVGDALYNESNRTVSVTAISIKPTSELVYNLSVERNNTYFISNTKVLVHNSKCKLPKSKRGKGSCPPSQRDPKRVWTKKEKCEELDKRGGKCDGCGAPLDIDDADGHHDKRHADGGKTDPDNLLLLCKPCHKWVHSK